MPAQSQPNNTTEGRIIEAAAQLFSCWGFYGTSTKEIARLADVNETTLFRYFKKKDLFLTAVNSRLRGLKLGRELENRLAADDEPAVVVPMILEFLQAAICGQPEVMRLLCFGALEVPEAQRIYREHLGAIFDKINHYLARSVARDALWSADPMLAALGLAGTVLAHQFLYGLFAGGVLPGAAERATSAAYAALWLRALKPEIRSQAASAVQP